MGRFSDARERLLAASGDLMHQLGYAAIGVAEICARAGVRKGSFYHFGCVHQSGVEAGAQ
ncbi:TetR/AcrR family transcriptional regulator [Rhodococcus zopfii]|uniref:TetR/AcrR family transcriptional regulator n=1 Tax=Rhodococcus zopfii TaxID=43772 RepID=UPI00365D3130